MATTQRVRRGGQVEPTGPRRERLAALVGALVVLVLWGTWLLLPHSDRPDGPVAPAGAASVPLPTWDGPATAGGAGDEPVAAAGDVASGPDAPPAAGQERAPARDESEVAGEVEEATAPVQAEPTAEEEVAVPQAGRGTFTAAPGGSEPAGEGRLITYTVEVEDGVPVDPAEAAAVVDAVLADPRSWRADGRWSLQRVPADGDARIVVTSPDTTDRLCAPLRTRGQVSCRNGDDVVLNALRWTRGASTWGDDVDGYRQYLVNHEVGHLLGHGHVPCPAAGSPAPVMLQQTIRLDGCERNAWPFP